MFEKYSYRTKLIALGIIFVLLLIVAYKRSFSLTLSSIQEIERLDLQLQNAEKAGFEINQLKLEINKINKVIGKENLSADQVQQLLLDRITDFSDQENIKLHGIEETHYFNTKDFEIYSSQMVVEGDFVSVLKLLYDLEKNVDYARVASTEFFVEENYRGKKKQLYAKILVQNFKKK